MPSEERKRITAWFAHHGGETQALQAANHELYKATLDWGTAPDDVLRDRTMTAARDLLAAVERCEGLPPMDVRSVDRPFAAALAELRRGSERLTSLPLDLDKASTQVMAAGRVLKAGYDGIGATTQAALRFGPA
jgi:hypothetical protein